MKKAIKIVSLLAVAAVMVAAASPQALVQTATTVLAHAESPG